jgi:ketosteroid isomerase-like protein
MSDRIERARAFYKAFADGNRAFVESILTPDFTFSAPPDPLLDRAGYFERCWPGAATAQSFEFKRLIESGDEVIVTYESRQPGANTSGRNTEILTFEGDKVCRAEVYFGWTIELA